MALKKVGNIYGTGGLKKVGNINDQNFNQPQQSPKSKIGSAWNWTTNQLIKPVAMASNALEDTGKTIAFPIAKMAGYKGSWNDAKKSQGIDFLGHQKDVLGGASNRTYSDITRDAFKDGSKVQQRAGQVVGYGGDFLLDPLNKLKIAALTAKGINAAKTGKVALSVAEQAKQGQRALIQLGKWNVLPSVGNRVLAGSTKLNDVIRGTETGKKLMTIGSKVSGKIRPGGVSRDEFKILTDAKTAARDTVGYTTGKAIEFAKGLAKELKKRKATDFDGSQLLHAIEKGREDLAPEKLKDLWKVGTDFKVQNEEAWKKLGGSVLDNYGMAHVATKEVSEAARKKALQGGKLFSTQTPQDIHREWMKVDGKIVNIKDAGIKYSQEKGYTMSVAKESKPGVYVNTQKPVKVEQASAQEINNALAKQGKNAIFQEDLPLAAARMGISTGRKQAGVEFLEATKGLKSEEAIKLANETYEKMTNPEYLRKAVKMFDSVQNIWKAQALVSFSYHVRNVAGNLWNNFLADVQPASYALAGELQKFDKTGKLSQPSLWLLKKAGYSADDLPKLVDDMARHGVINTGETSSDIARAVSQDIGKTSINPFSQRFALYRGNRAVGTLVEDNAKIAHFLSKRAEGYGVKEAAQSVKKYLFDYNDLTGVEKGLFKRIMPFYTWTSKNIPLQIQQFIENPGKFSKIGIAKKDIEQTVEQPNEKYLSNYISENAPIRVRKDSEGNTQYFLLGQWLPATAAFNFLSRPLENSIGMASPVAKLPLETALNKSSFFQNTLGEYQDLKSYPGQKASYVGLDLDPRTVNALRTIRLLNEIDKVNPAGIFGGKNKPSIWQDTFSNASNQRGGRYTPESSQMDRVGNMFYGKMSNYNPENAKYFYDKDTQTKVAEFDAEISRAKKNNQLQLAEKLIKQRNEFKRQRNGSDIFNKNINPYYK